MNIHRLKKICLCIVVGLSILVTFFFVVRHNQSKQQPLSACLTAEEKKDLEYLFRSLLFENYGAFVLFGTKPLCDMHLRDSESTAAENILQQWLDSLSDDKREEYLAWKKNKIQTKPDSDRNLYRGWLAWEKVGKTFDMKRYILRIAPLRGPASYELVFVNIQQAALTLAQNYAIFKNTAEMDFEPLQMVFELQNPDPIFWRKVLASPSHLTKGLLFGFGLRNSLFGEWQFSSSTAKASNDWGKDVADYLKKATPVAVMNSTRLNEGFIPLFGTFHRDSILQNHLEESSELGRIDFEHLKNDTRTSTIAVKRGEGSPSNFTIPLFGAIDGEATIQKYRKEKIEIEKAYKGKDLVEVTLQRLAS